MGAVPPNKTNSEYEDATNSMWMKLIQLWLTSFAIGIPALRFLFFLDFRNYEIIIAVFFTMLIFGTMYILDENDRLWRVNDAQPCDEVTTVTDGARSNSVNISSNFRNTLFKTTVDTPSTETNKHEATVRSEVV